MTRTLPFALVSLLLIATTSLPPSSSPLVALAAPLPLRLDRCAEQLSPRASDAMIAAYAKRSTTWSDEPIAPVELISYWPAITSPVAGQVLYEGSSFTLEWNNTFPPYPTNQVSHTAMLLLGYISDVSEGFHLDVEHPLAQDLQLYGGSNAYTFTLPTNLTTRSTYILVLGSTGNTSPQFEIIGTGPPDNETIPTSTNTGRTIEALPTTYILGGETTVIGQPAMTPAASSPPATSPAAASPTSTTSLPYFGSGGVVAAGSTTNEPSSPSTTTTTNVAAFSTASASPAVAGEANSSPASSAAGRTQVWRWLVAVVAIGTGSVIM